MERGRGADNHRANGKRCHRVADSLSFVVVPDKAPEVIIASPIVRHRDPLWWCVPVIIRPTIMASATSPHIVA
jgi:hypothetical protein